MKSFDELKVAVNNLGNLNDINTSAETLRASLSILVDLNQVDENGRKIGSDIVRRNPEALGSFVDLLCTLHNKGVPADLLIPLIIPPDGLRNELLSNPKHAADIYKLIKNKLLPVTYIRITTKLKISLIAQINAIDNAQDKINAIKDALNPESAVHKTLCPSGDIHDIVDDYMTWIKLLKSSGCSSNEILGYLNSHDNSQDMTVAHTVVRYGNEASINDYFNMLFTLLNSGTSAKDILAHLNMHTKDLWTVGIITGFYQRELANKNHFTLLNALLDKGVPAADILRYLSVKKAGDDWTFGLTIANKNPELLKFFVNLACRLCAKGLSAAEVTPLVNVKSILDILLSDIKKNVSVIYKLVKYNLLPLDDIKITKEFKNILIDHIHSIADIKDKIIALQNALDPNSTMYKLMNTKRIIKSSGKSSSIKKLEAMLHELTNEKTFLYEKTKNSPLNLYHLLLEHKIPAADLPLFNGMQDKIVAHFMHENTPIACRKEFLEQATDYAKSPYLYTFMKSQAGLQETLRAELKKLTIAEVHPPKVSITRTSSALFRPPATLPPVQSSIVHAPKLTLPDAPCDDLPPSYPAIPEGELDTKSPQRRVAASS